MNVGKGVTYRSPEGGVITIDADSSNPTRTGVNADWVYWNNLHLDSEQDLSVDVSGDHQVQSTGTHIIGTTVISFDVSSTHRYPEFDLKVTGLQEYEWYDVHINGQKAPCEDGFTDGKSDANGVLLFENIEL